MPSNNNNGTGGDLAKATHAEATALLDCSAHGCNRKIQTRVLIHKKYTLMEPCFCKACESRGQKKHFVVPSTTNRDPKYYRLPYRTSSDPSEAPHRPANHKAGGGNGGGGGEIAKLQKQIAALQKQVEDPKGAKAHQAVPDEVEATLEILQQAYALNKQVGADTTDLENKIAAKKAAIAKPPTLGNIFQKLRAAENHARQCLEATAKQQAVFETAEARAIKAQVEATALKIQYDNLVAEEAEAAKTAAFPMPEGYNMAQKERFKLALETFKSLEAQSNARIQQEKDNLQACLAQMDEEIQKNNKETGTPIEKEQGDTGPANMEHDGGEQPPAEAAAAAAKTPQPDLANPLPPTPGPLWKKGRTEENNKENVNPRGPSPADTEQAAREVRANIAALRAVSDRENRSRSPGARAREDREALDEIP